MRWNDMILAPDVLANLLTDIIFFVLMWDSMKYLSDKPTFRDAT